MIFPNGLWSLLGGRASLDHPNNPGLANSMARPGSCSGARSADDVEDAGSSLIVQATSRRGYPTGGADVPGGVPDPESTSPSPTETAIRLTPQLAMRLALRLAVVP